MKFSWFAALFLIIASFAGCGEEDQDSVIPGYIKPGEFRPKGILDKEYSFSDGKLAPDGTCPAGAACLAVYALWSIDNIPVEGIAVKDDDTVDSRLLLKMTRVKGAQWTIKLTYKGIAYTNKLVPADAIELQFCTTGIPTLPAYPDPDGDPGTDDGFDASETFLVKATATIKADIELRTEDKANFITLFENDMVIANAHSARGVTTCP